VNLCRQIATYAYPSSSSSASVIDHSNNALLPVTENHTPEHPSLPGPAKPSTRLVQWTIERSFGTITGGMLLVS